MFAPRAGPRHARARIFQIGCLVTGLTAAAIAALPVPLTAGVHEWVIDTLLTASASFRGEARPATRIVVVDIDTRSLASVGPWPWPRQHMARLVEAAGRGGAIAVGLDILFEGPDTKSSATLARRLGDELSRPDLVAWADTLEDGDRQLAHSFGGLPASVGFALDPNGHAEVPGAPVLTTGAGELPRFWRVDGGIVPYHRVLEGAAGVGALSLPGDDDGIVRRVPLFVGVANRIRPGIVAETIRLAEAASAYRIDLTGQTIGIGEIVVPLPPNAMLRLVPGQAAQLRSDVISAVDVLRHGDTDPRMRGAIVLIGGSAPELGGLRPATGDPLTATVILHAAAMAQLFQGIVPLPISGALPVTIGIGCLAAAAGLFAGVSLRPVRGALVIGGLLAVLAGVAIALAVRDRIFDPSVPMILATTAFAITALLMAAETQLREARVRQRFSQHLAPAVVELIAASPSRLKLAGERRVITALFTDVESFTALTHRAGPEALVAMLDEYFEGVTRIVIDHGGMIDKFDGDAVHAFFNMPLDLPDHPRKAVACALGVQAWTETWRRRGVAAEYGFGRTRIGVETGEAIVGDIGIRAKLDYTAHGDTVNSAARFEAANKDIGSAICVGPRAASCCAPDLLRPTGTITLRGFDTPVRTFEPWPEGTDAGWQARFVGAFDTISVDPVSALKTLIALGEGRPEDGVVHSLIRELTEHVTSSETKGGCL